MFYRGPSESSRTTWGFHDDFRLLDMPIHSLIDRDRIETFALAQRKSIVNVEIDIPGGKAGHTIAPMAVAGCYAPGGRYPLPSSVLMTAVTAKAAGG